MSTQGRPRSARRSTSGLVLGRVGGAPVILAPSWIVVAGFLTWLFLPLVRSAAPALGTVATVAAAAIFPVLLAISVLLHELGHGLTARRLGVPVTEYVITLWGGHTQFDREMRGPAASAIVSAAGPVTNGVLAGLCWWGAEASEPGLAALLLGAGAIANGFVAGFNLLPGLPLDGGRILEALVWKVTGERARGTIAAGWVGRLLAVALVVVMIGRPLLAGSQADVVTAITVLLVSGFLWVGASQAIRAGRMTHQAGVVDLLTLARPVVVVPPDATLADVDARLASTNAAMADGRARRTDADAVTGDARAAPPGAAVVLADAGGRPVALLDETVAATVPRALRATTPVRAVSTAVAPESVVSERRGVDAVRAMSRAQTAGRAAVLVDPATHPPRIVGVVRVESVAQALGRRAAGPPTARP